MANEMNKKAVLSLFEKIGNHIKTPVSVYLIGGGALALRNLKTATIDLDIICASSKDFDTQKGTDHRQSETSGMLASLGSVPLECQSFPTQWAAFFYHQS